MTIEEMKKRIRENYTEMYEMYYNQDNVVPLITEGEEDETPCFDKQLVAIG